MKQTVLFIAGLGGTIWEVAHPEPRPIVLGIWLLFLGFRGFSWLSRLFDQPPPTALPPSPPSPPEDQ